MRKVIDGRVYDTETADEVASFSNNLGNRDFRNVSEELYRTKKGAWFLSGEGGPMTAWAEQCGNTRTGSSGIHVIDESEAQSWCEMHNIDSEIIEKYFTVEEA